MRNLLYPKESNKLLELAFQLHNELGCGFKEKVYQDAFEILLQENDIPYEREKHLSMVFHGIKLEHDFFYDFLCYRTIGVEIKAISEITGENKSQLINYLHVGKQQLGLLVNFGTESLEYFWIPNKPNYQRK
jgi:GxxExxY protein